MVSRNSLEEQHKDACDQVLERIKILHQLTDHISECITADFSLTAVSGSFYSVDVDLVRWIERVAVLRSLLAE